MSTSMFVFTPNTLAAVRRHLAAGAAPPAIARALGCELGTLRNICARHGLRLELDRSEDDDEAPSGRGFRRRSAWPDWKAG